MILADTGPLYAAADQDDGRHADVRAFLERNSEPILVPATVLPEVCYFLDRHLGSAAEIRFMRSVMDGDLILEAVTAEDLPRCVEVMEQYADNRLGFVDASVVAVAERLNITRILTIDRRHFTVVRPRHVTAFELLP